MSIVVLGTLDTKGHEVAFVVDCLRAEGLDVLTVDVGTSGSPLFVADIAREVVLARAGTTLAEVAARGDRGHAVTQAASGAAAIVADLAAQGRVEGILALGGSAGTTIGSTAMHALPFGLPKVMISTLASGQTRPFVGGSDLVLFPSVADLAGLNRITRQVMANASAAMAGMVRARRRGDARAVRDRPVIAATMFGVTTPCVDRARRSLEESGYEVVVFHATGVGGQAMEGLIRDGQVAGVLDLTTTELADELVGGILSAGPDRLKAAAEAGIPQVVSVGALDMVNFGPKETVPDRFRNRKLHVHNANVTLMRTTAEENAALGRRMAEILVTSRGPTVILIPLKGVSALDREGQSFFDPEADAALFESLQSGLADHPHVRVVVRDEHINDPAFAEAAASALRELLHG
jgi:uncharacterized protein (UPF0261 family)